jgi:hypothetical protein
MRDPIAVVFELREAVSTTLEKSWTRPGTKEPLLTHEQRDLILEAALLLEEYVQLRSLVRGVRDAQKDYFKSRAPAKLQDSKTLERRLDEFVRD